MQSQRCVAKASSDAGRPPGSPDEARRRRVAIVAASLGAADTGALAEFGAVPQRRLSSFLRKQSGVPTAV